MNRTSATLLGTVVLLISVYCSTGPVTAQESRNAVFAPTRDAVSTIARPGAASVGPDGRIAIIDQNAHQVVLLDSTGKTLRTMGRKGSKNGTEFMNPSGVAWSPDGQLYVVDGGNNRIQLFNPRGFFRRMWGTSGGDAGKFHRPNGIAVDETRVYIADTGNHRIQVFDRRSIRFLMEIGSEGTDPGQFRGPMDVAVDRQGSIYVSDTDNDRVQKFDREGQFVQQWGGWGGANGRFNQPTSLALHGDRLFVCDRNNHRVQAFQATGGALELFASVPLQFPEHFAVARDGSTGVICEPSSGRFHLVGATTGEPTAVKNAYPAAEANRCDFQSGVLVLSDSEGNGAQVFDMSSTTPTLRASFGTSGDRIDQFGHVAGVAFDSTGSRVYVTDKEARSLEEWKIDGSRVVLSRSLDLERLKQLDERLQNVSNMDPGAIARGPQGQLFVLLPMSCHVMVFSSELELESLWGTYGLGDGQFRRPVDIAADTAGTVHVVDARRNRVQSFDSNGRFLRGFGPEVDLHAPHGVSVGADSSIFVTDTGHGRVTRFDASGSLLGSWQGDSGQLNVLQRPSDLCSGPELAVIVVDHRSSRGRIFSPGGRSLGWFRFLDATRGNDQ